MIFLSPSEILLRIVVLHRLKWTNRRTLQVPPRSISPSHLSVSLSLFILVAAPLRIKYSFGLHLMPLLENKKTWLRFDRRKIPPPPSPWNSRTILNVKSSNQETMEGEELQAPIL